MEYASQVDKKNHYPGDSFTVAAWNILLDRTHGDFVAPQCDRIAAQAKTLASIGRVLDVVAISEAEKTPHAHNGELLAALAGYGPGDWRRHSRKAEYIGMFGAQAGPIEHVDLGHKKTAVVTKIGAVSIAGVHLKFQLKGPERTEQIAVLLEYLAEEDQSVITGDFNCLPRQKPRRMLAQAGYISVFDALRQRKPRTVPTKAYRPMLTPLRKIGSWPGLNVDDIYVKNLAVHEAGSFIGASDHAGVWATLGLEPEK